jgi:hypothetical protein
MEVGKEYYKPKYPSGLLTSLTADFLEIKRS